MAGPPRTPSVDPPPEPGGAGSPGGRVVPTYRGAGETGESSLTTLSRQTNDAPLTSQTLRTWRTVGTLREKRKEVRT